MSSHDFSSFNLDLEPVDGFDGWLRAPITDWEQAKVLAAELRTNPAAQKYFVFVGALDNDGQYIYVTPPLSPREIVQAFGVGGHGGHSAESADREVGQRLEAVDSVCPFIVTYVDSAGLHAEFTRRLDMAAATKIEEIFTADEDAFSVGLESYESEWDGEGPLMAATLVAEQGLRLWWD